MKKVLKGALALAMAMSLAACGSSSSSSSSAESFKIGCSGPLSGDYAVYGNAVKNGVELAVKEINEQGDVNFEFKMEDDQGDPGQSPTCYSTLKDWGMQIGLSTVTSGAGAAVSQNYVDDDMFAITPSGSNTAVVFKDAACKEAYGNVFQMCFTDPNQGKAVADYIVENKVGTKVAVIYNNQQDYSNTIYTKFMEEAEEKGLEVVTTQSFSNDNDASFDAQVAKVKASGADVVFLPIYYTPAAKILKALSTAKVDAKVFGVDGMDGILDVEGFDKSLAEGVYLLTPFSATSTEEKSAAFVKAYKEAYDDETPNQFAADAYDAVYAIAQALKNGKATSDMETSDLTALLKEQFTSMTFDGVTGQSVTWAKTGEVSKDPMCVVITNGEYVLPNA